MEIQEYYDVDLAENIENKGFFYQFLKKYIDYRIDGKNPIEMDGTKITIFTPKQDFLFYERETDIKEPYIEYIKDYLTINIKRPSVSITGGEKHDSLGFLDRNKIFFLIESSEDLNKKHIKASFISFLKKKLRFKIGFTTALSIEEKSSGKVIAQLKSLYGNRLSQDERPTDLVETGMKKIKDTKDGKFMWIVFFNYQLDDRKFKKAYSEVGDEKINGYQNDDEFEERDKKRKSEQIGIKNLVPALKLTKEQTVKQIIQELEKRIGGTL